MAPLYRTLRATLEAEIAAGRYPVGARFPTDHELRARFRVSRHTVREALRAMQEAGVLVRLRGAGTVVAAPAAAGNGAGAPLDRDVGFALDHVGCVKLGPGLAAELGRPAGERWLRFAGLGGGADGAAPRWVEHYVAAPYAAIREAARDGEPLPPQLARLFGIATARIEMRFAAAPLSAGHAARLGAPPGGVGLVVRASHFADGAEAPFVVALSVRSGDGASETLSFRPAAPPD